MTERDTVRVQWTTEETTTYEAEIDREVWEAMVAAGTETDDLAEFEESQNEGDYSNDRTVDAVNGEEQ